MSDAELLDRFHRSPTPATLLPLYERYAELIYAWCLRYLGTPERAEDAGAEVFTVLLERLPKHEVSNFRSWLQTVVRNHCLMQLRREHRDPVQQHAPLESVVQSADWQHLLDEPSDTDTRGLHHCMKQLNDEQRRCIRLFYLQEGESYRSIAERLNLSIGQVRSHLQNGRRNLGQCLERYTPTQSLPRAD